MIDFSRAFDTAWERMLVILFRPFDLGKWCVIGFSAFLAGLLGGGNGFSYRGSYQQNFSHPTETLHQTLNKTLSALWTFQAGLIGLAVVVVVILALSFTALIYWLGARGQFLLLDNIVRNRAAIAEPWSRYAAAGNRVFFFQLLCFAAGFVVVLALAVTAFLLALPSIRHHHWPEGSPLALLILLGVVYVAFCFLFFCFVFLFREWGVPLIFRHDLSLRAALGETWSLIRDQTGVVVLFLLLRLALALALMVVSGLLCCFTCCLAALPYLGTVLLLPAILYLKCFSLECLAQLGPAYDVWSVDVPPAP